MTTRDAIHQAPTAPLRALLLAAALASLPGCFAHRYSLPPETRAAEPVPGEVAARFEYSAVTSATLTQAWRDGDAVVSQGELEVRVGRDEQPTEVLFEYWRSRHARGPAPAVLVTPILGGGQALARSHCRAFVRAGLHAVLVMRGTRVLARDWSVEDVERHLRSAVAARRGVVDWLVTLPEVDPARLGALGLSMGGVVTTALLAAEPRLRVGVVGLAGGDLASVILESEEERLVRFRRARMAELGVDPGQLEALLRAALPSDPLLLARYLDAQRLLLITTRYDHVVPPENQARLWQALGRPLRYDVPTGHYTAALYFPYLSRLMTDWLSTHLRA